MLTSTFIHIKGITPERERLLWDAGFSDWGMLQRPGCPEPNIPGILKSQIASGVRSSILALGQHDAAFFASGLRPSDHWRAVSHFRFCGLDIETNGGRGPESISVVGLHDSENYRPFVAGSNLDLLPVEMLKYDGFLTFYGTGFDLPFLLRRFPDIRGVIDSRLHVDLCALFHGLGILGGMKAIEKNLGIVRALEVDGLTGADAARLSRCYLRSAPDANRSLATLLKYNESDTANLWELLSLCLPMLYDRSGCPNHACPGIVVNCDRPSAVVPIGAGNSNWEY